MTLREPVVNADQRKERNMLVLVSFEAFFIGAFVALFLIGSHALFFQSHSIDQLPQALVISGIFGVLYFSLYTFLSTRISFRYFDLLNLAVIFILTGMLYYFYDSLVQFTLFDISPLLPLTLTFPLIYLVFLTFNHTVRNIYTPLQNRKYNPFIQGAHSWGIILASFTLVGMLYFAYWDILNILAASAVFIGIAMALQIAVLYYNRKAGVFPKPAKYTSGLHSKSYELLYSKFTFILLLFVLVSSISGFIFHFSFIEEMYLYDSSTVGMAKFLGFLIGTMFLFVFMIERFLIRKILYPYDSPYSLVLIPVVLAIFIIVSLIVDLLAGHSAVISKISFGLLMAAILRIGYETAFQVIELPSLRVLFRTLDLRFAGTIIQRMEGSFRMAALALTGCLLLPLVVLNLNSNLVLNLLLLLMMAAWLPLAIFLIKKYQDALRDTIRRLKSSKKAIEQELLNTDEKVHDLLNSSKPGQVIHALSLLEKLEPLKFEQHLISLLETGPQEIRQYLLEKIEENSLLVSLPQLKNMIVQKSNRQFGGYLTKIINRFQIKLATVVSRESIERLVNSMHAPDRMLAAEIIGSTGNSEFVDLLPVLSRDIEPDVKFAAVKAMARVSHADYSYILIGYLTAPGYYPYAFQALVNIGDPTLAHLEQSFLSPDADNTLLSRIVRIYGKIGSQQANELLLGKIENQNRVITYQAMLAMRESKFQATPGNINRILNDMIRLINIMSWNFAAYTSLGRLKNFNLLKDALQSEIQENYNTLYHLLALAYNPTSIGNIKNLLMEGSDLDISFAIELLDQIVHEDIKQVFFPVVANISHLERFKQLQYFFHAEKRQPAELISEIITRDFNSISLYVKACAIFNMLEVDRQPVSQELVSCVFHPDKLIRESAAYVIEKLEPGYMDSVYPRLEASILNEIKLSLSSADNGFPYLLLHRIRFLKQHTRLGIMTEDVILEIAKMLDVNFLNAGDEFLIRRNDVHYAFIIIFSGKIQIKISDSKAITFDKNDIIYSDILIEDTTFSLKALTDLKFFSLDQEVLNSLMFDHIDFRSSVLGLIEES